VPQMQGKLLPQKIQLYLITYCLITPESKNLSGLLHDAVVEGIKYCESLQKQKVLYGEVKSLDWK
jgi:hypothetical protein